MALTLDITGEVLEADVRQRRFQVWTDSKTVVSVAFDQSQEGMVTRALRDHRSIRMQIRGRAAISPQGKPIRFTEVLSLELLPAGEPQYDPSALSIEDEITQIAAGVPAEAWENLPDDLNSQLDHYLYGTPKQWGPCSQIRTIGWRLWILAANGTNPRSRQICHSIRPPWLQPMRDWRWQGSDQIECFDVSSPSKFPLAKESMPDYCT
jgi:hypothetical protein